MVRGVIPVFIANEKIHRHVPVTLNIPVTGFNAIYTKVFPFLRKKLGNERLPFSYLYVPRSVP